jgi:hypothetical protein
VTSINGAMAMQCVPNSGSCDAATACADDSLEENDTRAQAQANPPIAAGQVIEAISCKAPTSDDDFYRIELAQDAQVTVTLVGEETTDLDLRVLKSDGTTATLSTSFQSSEEIVKCLPAGTYYLRVNAFGNGSGGIRNQYLLEYTTATPAGGSCAAAAACIDDAREDDDTFSQARTTTFPEHNSTGNQICANDDDWYKVRLFTGDVLTVDLTFTQVSFDQDLDLHLYKGGVDLTPCDTSNPAQCSVANGQGAVSNEHTSFTVPAGCSSGCDYFVVVRGYDGSKNAYDIKIKVQ